MSVAQLSALAPGFGPQNIGPILSPLYPELFSLLDANNIEPVGPPIAHYLDDPSGNGIIVHAAVPIDPSSPATHDVDFVTLPAFATAVTVRHHGPMATIESSYELAMRWIQSEQLELIGYAREVYVDCPPDQADWITELQFEVRKPIPASVRART
jgi:effector-binding domain-containing protein